MLSSSSPSATWMTTAGQTLFDERRESFRKSFSAILDKLYSIKSPDELESRFENIINQYFSAEQEVFLSYLIFLIMQSNSEIMPPFFEEFRVNQKQLDSRYDSSGQIKKVLTHFRGNPSQKLMKFYPNYVSKIIGILCGTTVLHSFVNDSRAILVDFVANVQKLIKNTKIQVKKNLKGIVNEKILKRKEDEINLLQCELNKSQQIMKQRDKHRLELEGHAIRIIQYLNSIDIQKIEDTPMQLTLTELKKQSKSLRKAIKATTTDKIQISSEISDKTKLESLLAQNKIKDETIASLRKDIDFLKKNTDDKVLYELQSQTKENDSKIEESLLQTNYLKAKGELHHNKIVKTQLMDEVVQKTDRLRDYYEIKSDFDDLKLEYHALRQQKIQVEEYAEVLNQENIKLRKSNEELKTQFSSGNAGFEALYDKVQRLTNKISKNKQKLKEQTEKTRIAEEALQKKNIEIQNHINNIKNITEDHDTNAMKNDLLMEQITNLKMDVASKESDYIRFQKSIEEQKRMYEINQENEKVKLAEIEALKEKINRINLRKAKKDERIQQLQKLIDSTSVKVQEKDMIMDKYESKVNDQKSKIVSLIEKLTKASETIKTQKSKIKDLENQIADIHFKTKDIERQLKQKSEEFIHLKETYKNYDEIVKSKDIIERQLFQIKLELDGEKQKNNILTENLNSQSTASDQLRTELNESKKSLADTQNLHDTLKFQTQTQISQLKNEINSLKYDSEKEKERYEKEKTALKNKIEQNSTKVKSISAMKGNYENQISELKQNIIHLQDQITETNAQNKQKLIALQQISQQERIELTEKISISERKTKEQEIRNNDLTNLFEKQQKENEEFRLQLQNLLQSEDIIKSIQNLQASLSSSESIIKSFNNEIRKIKTRNQAFISEITSNEANDLEKATNNSPLSQLTALTSIVEASSRMFQRIKKEQNYQKQIFKEVQITDVEGIKDLNKKLNIAKQEALHYQGILRQIGESAPFKNEEALPSIISDLIFHRNQLQKENDDFLSRNNKIFSQLHEFLFFEKEEEIVKSVKELRNETKLKTKQLELLTKDFQKTIEIKSNFEEIINKVSQIIEVEEYENIPNNIENLVKSDQENRNILLKMNKTRTEFLSKINKAFVSDDEESIVRNVFQMKQTNKELLNEASTLKEDLNEKTEILSQIQNVINAREDNQLPSMLSKLVERQQFFEKEYKKNQEKHEKLVSQLGSITQISDEETIPLTIIKIAQQQKEAQSELVSIKHNHEKFVESIQQVISFKSEKQLPKVLSNIMDKQKILTSKSEMLDKIGQIISVKEESEIVSQITRMNQESKNNTKIINEIKNFLLLKESDDAVKTIKEKINVLSQIQSSLSVKNCEEIPYKIENLKEISESHSNLLDTVQDIVHFEKVEQLPQIIKNAVDMSNSQRKIIQNIEKYVSPYFASPPNDDQASILNNSSILSSFNLSPSKNVEIQRFQSIPEQIEKMIQSQNLIQEEHSQLIKSIGEKVSFQNVKEIPQVISKIINKSSKKSETIASLKKILNSLQDFIPFEQYNEIPQKVLDLSKKLDETKKVKSSYESVANELKSYIEFENISSLPQKLKEITTKQSQSNDLIEDLRSKSGLSNYEEIPQVLSELIEFKEKTNIAIKQICSNLHLESFESLPQYSKEVGSLFDSIKLIEKYNNIKEIYDILKKYKEIEKFNISHVNFIKMILTRILGQSFHIEFPFDDNKTEHLLKIINDYAAKHETMKLDFDKLMVAARSLGFTGNSCVEASDFLAEELCKKKAQEQLEEMVNQMKILREDKDRERKLFEQRNQKNNEKLKELRQSKSQLIEQYAQKQSELYDTIESLQKETREMETKVEKLAKTKEELIRIIAHEPYDQDSLRSWLNPNEKTRINL